MTNEELGFELYRLRELALTYIPQSFRKLALKFMGKKEFSSGEEKEKVIRAYLKSRLFEDDRVNQLWNRIKEIKQKLFVQNQDMIYHLLRRYRIRNEDWDDAYSYACEGLLRAIDNYNYTYGTKFSTIAYQWISSYIQRFLSFSKRSGLSLDVNINEGEPETFLDFCGVEDDIAQRDLLLFLEKLPDKLREVALLLMDGVKQKEVCVVLGLSPKEYQKRIEALKRVFEEYNYY